MEPFSTRILLVADTHLGFDLPSRPRVVRRRRGHDFFANFERALAPALKGEVDMVVHGGDLLFRSRVQAGLVHLAMEPLMRVAALGVPVFIVPGNHERSRIPFPLLTLHPNVHVFDVPRTFHLQLGGVSIAVSGFPFVRSVRDRFGELTSRTCFQEQGADIRLLCVHQTVEGAQVGVVNYTFRSGRDVIRGGDIPGDFAAVLAGHIHRGQQLTRDLRGQPMAAPVVYPGAVERTSFAERDEEKGYVLLEVAPSCRPGGRLVRSCFVPLPARPMVALDLDHAILDKQALASHLRRRLAAIDPDAVVRIRLRGEPPPEPLGALRAENLRALAPASMNISVSHGWRKGRTETGSSSVAGTPVMGGAVSGQDDRLFEVTQGQLPHS